MTDAARRPTRAAPSAGAGAGAGARGGSQAGGGTSAGAGASTSAEAVSAADRRPAGMCTGPGHVIVYGNEAFVAAYGAGAVGLPAREAMLDVPPAGFAVLDAVYRTGRPLARWIRRNGDDRRLTVAPRRDPETHATYGVGFHLRRRSDLPIVDHQDTMRSSR